MASSGWTVYLLECADGSYLGGMTRSLKREVASINGTGLGIYFKKHPERLPVKPVFAETRLPFKEAYAKKMYLSEMTRRLRKKLIETKKWPMGGALRQYIFDTQVTD